MRIRYEDETKGTKKNLRVKQISCGEEHTGIVTECGRVLMCGSHQFGKLGFEAPGGKDYLNCKRYTNVDFGKKLRFGSVK